MDYSKHRIVYVVADLKRIGPTNQTLNIIRFSGAIQNCVVVSLFEESEDTQIQDYIDCGIEVICLKLSRKTALLLGVGKLRTILESLMPSIVHSWGTFADILTYYATKKMSVQHMVTLRNFPVEEMTTRMNYVIGMGVAHLDLHILKHCKHVVACSYAIKNKMETTYGWKHLDCIQNGVDFEKFHSFDRDEVRKKLGFSQEDLVFISTGSIIPRKRISETADAFIQARFPYNMKLIFLGDGSLLPGMRKKYMDYSSIMFLGKIQNVAEYLSAADVFVSSSESEGMPNAVLEALACNLPVLLSDIPQHIEVLETVGECGVSYSLGNVSALCGLFRTMSEGEKDKYKTNAQKIRESKLTMERMGSLYRDYYAEVLKDEKCIENQ